MIKFVLHGGETSRNSPDNDLFFGQFTSLVEKDNVNILMCYWAKKRHRWEETLKRDVEFVKKHSNKTMSFIMLDKPADLKEKMKDCDVLYVAGGDAENIEPYYAEIKDLKDYLANKVYIGSSMGAFLVASSYVLSMGDQDVNTVHNGLGILPINILCHWDIEDKKERKLKLLNDKSSGLPILTLDECKFTTLIY